MTKNQVKYLKRLQSHETTVSSKSIYKHFNEDIF